MQKMRFMQDMEEDLLHQNFKITLTAKIGMKESMIQEIFDANYSARLLNDYEKRNAEFLSEMEYSIDSRGYQLDQ